MVAFIQGKKTGIEGEEFPRGEKYRHMSRISVGQPVHRDFRFALWGETEGDVEVFVVCVKGDLAPVPPLFPSRQPAQGLGAENADQFFGEPRLQECFCGAVRAGFSPFFGAGGQHRVEEFEQMGFARPVFADKDVQAGGEGEAGMTEGGKILDVGGFQHGASLCASNSLRPAAFASGQALLRRRRPRCLPRK